MVPLSLLRAIAMRAGLTMISNFSHTAKAQAEWKTDDTPVTPADIEINEMVISTLKDLYPGVSVISEEGSRIVPGAEWMVYCDPIDGTIPYATGMGVSTFCISLLHNGVPLMAVIYDPFCGRMYTAEKGKGAFVNNKPLRVSEVAVLGKESHVHLIWWKGSYDLSSLCEGLIEKGSAWTNFCSVGIVGGLVAAGQFEASVFPGTKIWETAAMAILVEEAGGKCTDLEGNPINYLDNGHMNGHIVSNGLVHDELLKMI